MAAILARAGDGALGRPHIAEALVEGGHAGDFPEAFAKYIGEDCPAYVEKYKITPADAVEHIHLAGGLAFVAHPGYYLEDMDAFAELLSQGFDGIEVLHPHHRNGVVETLQGVADERGLLVSGGSDFHGFAGRDNMGLPKVPYELLADIKERLAA
jgi:predicted metal-dependent phosphoesterase TrpH